MANTIIDVVSDVCQPYTKRKNTHETRCELCDDFVVAMDILINNGTIHNYEVMCDDTNNTPIILADGKLIAEVKYYLKNDSAVTDITCTIVLNQPNLYEAFDYAMKGI